MDCPSRLVVWGARPRFIAPSCTRVYNTHSRAAHLMLSRSEYGIAIVPFPHVIFITRAYGSPWLKRRRVLRATKRFRGFGPVGDARWQAVMSQLGRLLRAGKLGAVRRTSGIEKQDGVTARRRPERLPSKCQAGGGKVSIP